MAEDRLGGSQPKDEPLKDIPDDDLNALVKILRKDIPSSHYAIGMVENVIRWRKNKYFPLYHQIYMSLEDLKDGAAISIFNIPEISYSVISFFSQDEDGHGLKMMDALIKSKLINWAEQDKFMRLYAVTEEMNPGIDKLVSEKNLEKLFHYRSETFWMGQEQARNLKVECPPGVKLEKLTTKHIVFIDENWPRRFEGCKRYLEILIERNFTLGLFLLPSEDPVAWVVVAESSAIAMLFVLPTHRRRGYAQLLTIATAKKLGEMGIDPHGMVADDNHASKKMFQALGFKSGGYCYHVGLRPNPV